MHFLRLTRPVNLLVVVLTMYSMRVYFEPYMLHTVASEPFDFFLLVFSTVLIAAAGNIINDYFDVKADKINKPEKVIIGKYVKPRWAIVSHWILNFIAFSIACYLSWRYRTFWYVFVHLFSINALWFYSMHLKRRFFIGNFTIAVLTALVPLLCGFHFLHFTVPYHESSTFHIIASKESWLSSINLKIFFTLFFAFFAGGLNLIRELIKDIQDIEGDLALKAKTIPIVIGAQKSRYIAIVLLLVCGLLPLPFVLEGIELYQRTFLMVMAPGVLIAAGLLICILMLLVSKEKKQLKRTDLILKLIMVIGCLFPFYWSYILHY